MPKISSNDLFTLIKSLDKHEKRRFKLFAKARDTKEDMIYLKLFDAIEKQKEFDEKNILIKIPELGISKLNKTKYVLQELILDSIRHYQSSGIDVQLTAVTQNINILLEKGLFKICQKKLLKAKETAKEHEKFLQHMELLFLEYELIRAQSFLGHDEKAMVNLYDEVFTTISKYKNLNEYMLLLSRTQATVYHGASARGKEGEGFFRNILSTPALKNEKQVLSNRALYFFYFSHILCHSRLNEPEKAYPYLEKISGLMDHYPAQITQKPYTHIGILNNLANNQLALKKYCAVPETLKKMREVPCRSKLQERLVFYLSNLIELVLYNSTGKFENGIKLIASINNQPLAVLDKQQQANIDYYFSCIYFGVGNYTAANKYLQLVLRDVTDFRVDLQCFARILQLIIYYETEKQDLLEYSVKSTYRFLYKRNRLYKMETVLLDFIRKDIRNMNSKTEIRKGLEALHDKLQGVFTSSYEQSVLSYFDILAWLNSKIKNISFEKAIQQALPHNDL